MGDLRADHHEDAAPINKEIEAWCYLARGNYPVESASQPGTLGTLYAILAKAHPDRDCMRVMSEFAHRYISHAAAELQKAAPRMVFQEGSELETLVVAVVGQFRHSGDTLPIDPALRDEIMAELYDWELLLMVNKVHRMGSDVGPHDQKTAKDLLTDFVDAAGSDSSPPDGSWLSDRKAARRTELIQIISTTSVAMLAQTLLHEIDFPSSTLRIKKSMDKWRAQMPPVRWLESEELLAYYKKKCAEDMDEMAKLRDENQLLKENTSADPADHPDDFAHTDDQSAAGSEPPKIPVPVGQEFLAELERLRATVPSTDEIRDCGRQIRQHVLDNLDEGTSASNKGNDPDPQYDIVAKFTKDGVATSVEKTGEAPVELSVETPVPQIRKRRKRASVSYQDDGGPEMPKRKPSTSKRAKKAVSAQTDPSDATPGSASLALKETWSTPGSIPSPGDEGAPADQVEMAPHRRVQKRVGKFTPEEDACITQGLTKHGWGNWAPILNDGGFPEGRTPVHLKDRARTLKLKGEDFPPRPRGGRGRPPAVSSGTPSTPRQTTPSIVVEPPPEIDDGTRQIEGPEAPPET